MIYIRKYKAEYVIAMLFHVLEVLVFFKVEWALMLVLSPSIHLFFICWLNYTCCSRGQGGNHVFNHMSLRK